MEFIKQITRSSYTWEDMLVMGVACSIIGMIVQKLWDNWGRMKDL